VKVGQFQSLLPGDMMQSMNTTTSRHDFDIAPFVGEYRQRGYIKLSGLFSQDEAAQWRQECDRLLGADFVQPDNVRTPFRMNSGSAPERVDPVVDVSPVFKQVVGDSRILRVLEVIFGDKPLLFKDKIIFKAPGTDGYTPHQDQAWWHICPPDDILSVSIQIDGASRENGCIELIPGQHHRLISAPNEFRQLKESEVAEMTRISAWEPMETKPGDVLIFHSLAPHRSGKNLALTSRRSLYLTYSAAKHGDLYPRNLKEYIERLGKENPQSYFR